MVISEVMIDPQGTDSPNEFVELVNIGVDSVDLTGWRLGDLSSIDDLSGDDLTLWPGQYAVIFEGDYSPDSGAYAGLVPPDTHLLFAQGNSIGDGLANGADSLFLRDSSGAIIDRMGWSEAPAEGFTLEKVLLGDCDTPGNWRSSLQPLGTPGGLNSVRGQRIDLSLDSLSWSLGAAPNRFKLTAIVTNRGLRAAAVAQLAGPEGPLAMVPELEVGATLKVFFDWIGPDTLLGFYTTTIWVTADGDYDQSNDSLDIEIYLSAPAATVRISEIMYRPLSMDPEWVEVFNPSGNVINLKQWVFWDQATGATLPEYHLIPGEYLVLAADSSVASGWPDGIALVTPVGFPTLNNSGDQVTLTGPYSTVIDQLDYSPFPQTAAGISLEKVVLAGDNREGNWRPSRQLHGTPGATNSVAGEVIDLALDSLAGTFDATAGRFEVTAFVSNPGLEASGGRLMAAGSEVADINLLSPGGNEIVSFPWSPPEHYGLLELAVWIAAAQDYDATNDSGRVQLLVPARPEVVLINEIMFAPPAEGPEWVELLVNTPWPVNPAGWRLADSRGGARLPSGEWESGSLVVVTGDSSLAVGLPLDARLLVVSGFPVLNNAGDVITLSDPSGVIVDRVDYSSMDLSVSGRSLERVSPQASSNEPSNWRPSPDIQGHTAGRPNAAAAAPGEEGLTLEPNPLRINRPESRLVLAYATPFASINLHVTVYDLAGRRIGTIYNGGPLPGSGEVTWDARSLDPVRHKTGQYLLVFKAVDAGSTRRWERLARLIIVR